MGNRCREILICILNILLIGFVFETAVSAGCLCAGYLIEGLDLGKALILVRAGTMKSRLIIFPCLLMAFFIAGYIGKIIWNIHEKQMDYFKLVALYAYFVCCFSKTYEIIYLKLSFFIIILFVCIMYQSNHYKKMIEELEQMNRVRDERSKKVEEMSRIRHDISNHLVAAGYGEGSEYKKEIVRRIDDMIPITGIAVGDTLLEYKKKLCEEKNIHFECNRCRLKGESVELYDWISIFGNVLDNAIEACDKVEAERFIKMKLFYHEDFLCIEVKNSKMSQDFRDQKRNLLREKMKFKDKRGLGLGIVNDILMKYNGMISFHESENSFEVHILMQT